MRKKSQLYFQEPLLKETSLSFNYEGRAQTTADRAVLRPLSQAEIRGVFVSHQCQLYDTHYHFEMTQVRPSAYLTHE